MKLLVFWDVYWRVWRQALIKELPLLIGKYSPDFVIANVDNLSSWRGPIEKHILELEKAWVDIMTSGDHFFDNFDKIKEYLSRSDSKLIRFANYYDIWEIPWRWYSIIEKNWKRLLLIHLQWEVFMWQKVNNPFIVINEILNIYKEEKLDWIVIDFHKEATSEISWFTRYLDWKVSLVFWTHTHVQTNDEIILPLGTWMISDVGMCGPLDSVIWADYDSVINRFILWNLGKKTQSLSKSYVVSWLYVELAEDKKCEKIEKIRIIKK